MPQEIYVRLSMADNGIGVTPEHYHDIFKRFYREDKVHDSDGIGVGLYLSNVIITMQGGYITVRDNENEGAGTVFDIYLPKSHSIVTI